MVVSGSARHQRGLLALRLPPARAGSRRLLDAGLELPDGKQAQKDTSVTNQRVERILAILPQRCRAVLTYRFLLYRFLLYRFLLGYSIKETAVALGIGKANVKVIQLRALKKASEIDPANLDHDGSEHDITT